MGFVVPDKRWLSVVIFKMAKFNNRSNFYLIYFIIGLVGKALV